MPLLLPPAAAAAALGRRPPPPPQQQRAAAAAACALLARRLARAEPRGRCGGPVDGGSAAAAARWCAAATAAQPEAAGRGDEQQSLPHVSVLLQEVLHNLNHMPIKVFVDCTLGAGGHTAGMVQQHPELEVAVGIDVDPVAHELAAARLQPLLAQRGGRPALHQLRGNYSEVVPLLSACAAGRPLVGAVDGMLMDLGVSSMQIDSADRGFSFMADGPLDMRMDPHAALSAEELVNCAPEAELGRILRDYGEEKSWRAVARRIASAREEEPIRTTRRLVEVVGQTVLRGGGGGGRRQPGGGGGGRGIHPATRTFQALRIAVNEEIVRLEKALPAAIGCLSPGGRLAVISFHSLEDRAVKHAFLSAAGRPTPAQEALVSGPDGWRVLDSLAAGALGRLVTRKPVVPGEAEVGANPRSRSAKLRVFERAGGEESGAGAPRRGSRKRRLAGGQQQSSGQAAEPVG